MVAKTRLEGMNFAVALLGVLYNKFNSLRSRIDIFVKTMSDTIKEADSQIASRCQDNGGLDQTKEAIIRFYDRADVVSFTTEMVRSKERQKGIAADLRGEIVKAISGEKNFARANASINKDRILEIFDTTIRTKAVALHDEVRREDNEKIINRNIIEQLSEQFTTDDALRAFAKDVIEKSGVFAEFDTTEVNRAVKNNAVPEVGKNIYRKIVFINLPEVKGNEAVGKFEEKLEKALKSSVEAGVQVCVDNSGTRKNEITIASITYCFPFRVLRDLKFLEERYAEAVNNPNTGRENRTVLHTEGTGEQCPPLYAATEASPTEIRKQYTKYLIAAYAMGQIRYADKEDGTGRKAYGTISISRTGLETLNPLADKFTEIPFAYETFTEAFGESLQEKVEAALKGEYLHVDKRNELIKNIQHLIVNIILPECDNNKGSEQFRFFNQQAEAAMDVIEQAN